MSIVKNGIEFIQEPIREIPVRYTADVLVCGGGTSGIAAAICAGRMGLKVVMIERSSMAGGMMSHVVGGVQDGKGKGGFVAELLKDFEQRGFNDPRVTWCTKYNRNYVPYYLDELLHDAKVRVLYLSVVVAPLMENGRVAGAIIESKSGRIAIRSAVTIDATGDGDVAVGAGAKSSIGRMSDGLCQAITISAPFLEYSGETIEKTPFSAYLLETAQKAGYTLPSDKSRLVPMPLTKQAWDCGIPHVVGHDVTDVESLSDALVELRAQMWSFFQFCKNHLPMFEQASLGPVAAIPGVRESRRIECDEMVTSEDAIAGRKRDDGLFTVYQCMDIHKVAPGESSLVLKPIQPYHIPYGALLPRGVENLLVIGRCIGGDHEALSSYRVMGDCLAMGEAAAIAAEKAIRGKCTVRTIDVKSLCREMASRGYVL